MENKIVNLQVNDNINETNKSLGTLKSQLRDAQNEVNSLSEKFGATSREAVEAAKQAAVLKDKIGDAKALTDAFNPDAKFKAVSASLSGVASGFAAYQGAMGLAGVESKDLEQQLLKVQSAMAIAQGLQGLGEARDSFKQLKAVGVNAFNAIKGAIGATGIGLIVLAAGAIYAYWDDIKGAVSGVSEEQKRLNGLSQINADQAANKLKDLNNQDNVLKLQGKSEKEILNIKIKATDEAISAAKINIKNQEISNAAAVEGAKRNYQYLKSAIDFVTIPQRYLFENAAKAINSIITLINKIPGVEIDARLDEKFGDKAAEFITKLAFDPEKTKAEGKETVNAAKESIDKMVNDRAGMKLAINAIDKTASDKTKELSTKANEDAKAGLEELQKATLENELRIAAEKRSLLDEQIALLNEGVDAVQEAETKKNQITEESVKLTLEQEKALADGKKAIQEQTLANIDSGLNLLKDLFEGNKDVQKGLIIAESAMGIARIIIGTQAADAADTAAAALMGPAGIGYLATKKVLNRVSAGLGIAANIAATSKALSALGGGAAPSGSAGGSASGGAAPQFNVVGQGGANQLAQGMANQEQAPVQAYVVAGAVTSGQALNRNIINNASMG